MVGDNEKPINNLLVDNLIPDDEFLVGFLIKLIFLVSRYTKKPRELQRKSSLSNFVTHFVCEADKTVKYKSCVESHCLLNYLLTKPKCYERLARS